MTEPAVPPRPAPAPGAASGPPPGPASAVSPSGPRGGARRWALIALLLVAVPLLAWQAFALWGFDPLLRWAAPRWVAQHTGHRLQIAHAELAPWRAAMRLDGVDLHTPQGAPLASVQRLEIDLDGASLWRRALLIDTLRVTAPVLHAERAADGRLNWDALRQALAGPPAPPPPADAQPFPWALRQLALVQGQVHWRDAQPPGGFAAVLQAVSLQAEGLSSRGDAPATLRLQAGANLGSGPGPGAVLGLGLQGQWTLKTQRGQGGLALQGLALPALWPYLRPWLPNGSPDAPLQGQVALSSAWQAALGADPARAAAPDLRLSGLQLDARQLALAGPVAGPASAEPGLALQHLALQGGSLNLAERRVALQALRVDGGQLRAARDAQGQIDWQAWLQPAPAPAVRAAAAAASAPSAGASAPVSASAPAAPGAWHVQVAELAVRDLGLRWLDAGFAEPLAVSIGRLGLRLGAEARFGDGPPQFTLQGLQLQVADVQAASAGQPWLDLAELQLADSSLHSDTQRVDLGALALRGGRLQARRAASGQLLPLAGLALRPVAPGRAVAARAVSSSPPNASSESTAPPWQLQLGPVTLAQFALHLQDDAVQPPLRLTLDELQAELRGLSSDLSQPVTLSLGLRASSGGRAEVRGQLRLAQPQADLQLTVDKLALSPAAPYVAQHTALSLVDGQASAQGRLHWGGGPHWRWQGAASVQNLRLDERAQQAPLLAWRSLATRTLQADPQGLRIGELVLDGFAGRLTIFKDRSINLVQALKPVPADGAASAAVAPASVPASGAVAAAAAPSEPASAPVTISAPAPAPSASASAPVPASAPAASAPPFSVAIERIRVQRSELDFADLSLALPFAARVHDLSGNVVGLASAPDAVAQVALQGRVDEYGLARANGELKPFDPTAHMDLKVQFRNVEMTSLTPYSATFAGRRIDSGKLSLDLQYRIEARQLLGDNQIRMERLVLGERVDTPGALNLPLDLAVALLEDSDGVIELGLPVSGSLDDPQFSYGQIIWAAVRNVLTKIVTAPFRALASLLGGGGDEPLDRIGFDPGRAELLPPEREKLQRLAQAMAKRPALAITVPAPYDPEADAQGLRRRALRLAVAQQMAQQSGQALAPGENPAPLALTDAATQRALQALFTQRFGAEALAALQREAAAAPGGAASAPDVGEGAGNGETQGVAAAASDSVATAASAASGVGASPAAARNGLYGRMLARLQAEQPLPPEALPGLAQRRAAAIQAELGRLGVAAERVQVGAPSVQAVEPARGAGTLTAVPAVLAVRVGERGAAAASPASGPASGSVAAPEASASASAPAPAAPVASAAR